jgi:hypothetical protein
MILIVGGIAMSLLNFSTKAYAGPDAIYGTTTYIDSMLLESWLQWAGRWLYDHYYCMEQPSNCCIVFAN